MPSLQRPAVTAQAAPSETSPVVFRAWWEIPDDMVATLCQVFAVHSDSDGVVLTMGQAIFPIAIEQQKMPAELTVRGLAKYSMPYDRVR